MGPLARNDRACGVAPPASRRVEGSLRKPRGSLSVSRRDLKRSFIGLLGCEANDESSGAGTMAHIGKRAVVIGAIEGYDEMIVLRDIGFESHCEHHMMPIIGRAWVAYIPNGRVVGISKLARVVDVYAKRLQIQEKMTAQIANTINDVLKPQGVGVIIKATHHCMTTRGVHKPGTDLVTSRMLGCFRDNAPTRQEFLGMAT